MDPAQAPSGDGWQVGARGPSFCADVPTDGYAWWYLDAISDDGSAALTVIVFCGSVFSPYYFAARRRGTADPKQHYGINVALYRPQGRVWAFTEYGRTEVEADTRALRMGSNRLVWRGGSLFLDIDERTAPWRSRLRGQLRLTPAVDPESNAWGPVNLDLAGRHRWLPVAPCARVDARFERPQFRFSGSGYADSNWGDEPLEHGFRRWNWLRSESREETRVIYDLVGRGDKPLMPRALAFVAGQRPRILDPEALVDRALPGGRWGLPRSTRADPGTTVGIVKTLEDSPFYARSMLRASFEGQEAFAMHESLDLDRFSRRSTQWLLPFRILRGPRSRR